MSDNNFRLRKLSFQCSLITFLGTMEYFGSLGDPSLVVARETHTHTDIPQDVLNICIRTNKTAQAYAKYLSGNCGKV